MENRSKIGQGVVKESLSYSSRKFLIILGFTNKIYRSLAVTEAKICMIYVRLLSKPDKKSVKKSVKERSNGHDPFILGYSFVSKDAPKISLGIYL